MRYLREAPFEEAMPVVYGGVVPEALQHNVWTGDFMAMGVHDVPCPVCWNNHAILYTNVSLHSGRRQFQPCHECEEKGWQIVRLPRWLRRFFSKYPD